MRVPIISNLSINRDLHAPSLGRIDRKHRALVIRNNTDNVLIGGPLGRVGLGTHLIEGVGVRGLRGAGRDARAGGDDVRRAGGAGRRRGAGDREGAALDERAADGEDDTEGHRGCEDGGHAVGLEKCEKRSKMEKGACIPGDDGLDGVIVAGGLHDEPE